MTRIDYIVQVVSRSGTVGLVTVAVLFVCFGVALERVLFWWSVWGWRGVFGALGLGSAERRIEEVVVHLRDGRFDKAASRARTSSSPALRLLGVALGQTRSPEAWPHVRTHVVASVLGGNLTMGRRFLGTCIQGFGLLGMLGTCKGLYAQMTGASAAAQAETVSLAAAMSGMGEAFTTTLVGLTAAGVVTLLYLPNEIMIERFRRQLVRFDHQIRAALVECPEPRR